MLKFSFNPVKRLIDWYYSFEIPEVDEPRSLELKECEANLSHNKRLRLLRLKPNSLISWVKYQRALRPRLTGNRTPAMVLCIYLVIQLFWIDIYHPPFELRRLSLIPWMLIGLWFLVIDNTEISLKVQPNELIKEYFDKIQRLDDVNLASLGENFKHSIGVINGEENLFWNKWALKPTGYLLGAIFVPWVFGKIFDTFIVPSTIELSKLYEMVFSLLTSSGFYFLVMLWAVPLIFIYLERYSVPRSRLKRVQREISKMQ
jgi:hypothetical protein